MTENEGTIEIASILSQRTKRGLVEIHFNGTKVQLDVAKAREVLAMLHGAVEAAVSDEIFFKLLTNLGLSEEAASRALLDLRELRQGTRGTSFPN